MFNHGDDVSNEDEKQKKETLLDDLNEVRQIKLDQ